MSKKIISIVTPCYNEEDNVDELVRRIGQVFDDLPQYDYEHIFIDNASVDGTVKKIESIISKNKRVRLIVNSRNFGHIRSPYYGLLQAKGDAVVLMASDLQDPPPVILEFIKKWEAGSKIVIGVKNQSLETPLMFMIRKSYYNLINKLSEIKLVKNYTGFGLYDQSIVEILRGIKDPYPYFRGLIFELGFEPAEVTFTQPVRKRGITKNNFLTLYDIAMLGICSHSKIPLRIATMTGFMLSILSLFVAFVYTAAKLIFWDTFVMGMAPVVFGLFFFASVQLFFLGILGEYIGFIYTKQGERPLVYEKYRVNF